MAVFLEGAVSTLFTSLFYLVMIWLMSPQAWNLGVAVALYELTPNLVGLVWPYFVPKVSAKVIVCCSWLLRLVGGLVFVAFPSSFVRLAGIFLVATTTMLVTAVEKTSVLNEAKAELEQFIILRQIQLVAGIAGLVLGGIFPSRTGVLETIILALGIVGLGLGMLFPPVTIQFERKEVRSHWPAASTLGVALLMFLLNLTLWGPETIVMPRVFKFLKASAVYLSAAMAVGYFGELGGLWAFRRFNEHMKLHVEPAIPLVSSIYALTYVLWALTSPRAVGLWVAFALVSSALLAPLGPLLNRLISSRSFSDSSKAGNLSQVISFGNLGEPIGALISGGLSVNPLTLLGISGASGLLVSLGGLIVLRRPMNPLTNEIRNG